MGAQSDFMLKNPFDLEDVAEKNEGLSLDVLIRRVAAIEDDLRRIGADQLIAEEAAIKDTIKALMMKQLIDTAYDETSGWEAVMSVPLTDTWEVDKTKAAMTATQRKRYIVEVVDHKAVAQGVKNGDLSRAKLEETGAVTKVPKNSVPTLNVKQRKETK